jgi:hypothetical protein
MIVQELHAVRTPNRSEAVPVRAKPHLVSASCRQLPENLRQQSAPIRQESGVSLPGDVQSLGLGFAVFPAPAKAECGKYDGAARYRRERGKRPGLPGRHLSRLCGGSLESGAQRWKTRYRYREGNFPVAV